MTIMFFVTDIIKGAVRGYERRLANGRVVQVSPHSNSRGASKDAHTSDLFARPKAPPMKASPFSDECMKKPEKCTNDLFGGEGATAEQLHAAVQNAKSSGVPIHKSILVFTEDLLKATVKKEMWIPASVKKDGTVIHAHHKMVNVSDDHDHAKVGNGQGSHYQKAAHKKLSAELKDFGALGDHDKAMLVLAHATDLQAEASLSAAVSGWKAAMLAGQTPTSGQKKAYFEYAAKYPVKVAKMATDIESAIGAEKAEALMGVVSKKTENSDTSPVHVDANDKKPMTPKEYGAAAFAAGKPHAAGIDQDFLQAHNHLPYAEYMDALQEWSVGWNAANIAAPVPEPAKHPDLKTGAVLKLDSQYAKMNAGDWTIYNQSADSYQMHKVGATVPGPKNTVSIPKETLHAALAAGTAKVVLQADDSPKDGDTKQGEGGTLTFKDGRWHKSPSLAEKEKAEYQAKMADKKVVDYDGGKWYLLAIGAKLSADETVYAHLSSVDQGTYQKNGFNPKQVAVWLHESEVAPDVDPHTIPGVDGWHASLDAGKVPTVEQHEAMTYEELNGQQHISAAIAKHGLDKVGHLIDKAGEQWLAASKPSTPDMPSQEAINAVIDHMSVLAHVPSEALERVVTALANNAGLKPSALKTAVQHLKAENKKQGGKVGAPVMPDVPPAAGETVLFDNVNGHHVKVVKTADGFYQSFIDDELDGDGWSSPMYALDQAMQTAGKMDAAAGKMAVNASYKGHNYQKQKDGSWKNILTGQDYSKNGWKAAMFSMLAGEIPAPASPPMHSASYELAVEVAVQNEGADPIKMLNLAFHPGQKTQEGGPKEGDVKEINGKNYVLFNGRWHLQVAPSNVSAEDEHALKLWISAGMPQTDNTDKTMWALWHSLTNGQQEFLKEKAEQESAKPAASDAPAPSGTWQVSMNDEGFSGNNVILLEHTATSTIYVGWDNDLKEYQIGTSDADGSGSGPWSAFDKNDVRNTLDKMFGVHMPDSGMLDKIKGVAAAPAAPAAQPATGYKWIAHMENKKPGHNKFYKVEVHGTVLTKTYGKIGQKGHSGDEVHASNDAAVKAAIKLVGMKGANGYSYVGSSGFEPIPTEIPPIVIVFKKKKKLTKAQQIAAVPVPDYETLDPHQNSKIYVNISTAIKNAVLNGGVTGLKQYVTFHNDGSVSAKQNVTGFKTGKCTSISTLVRRQQFYKFCQQMHAAALGKFDPEAEGVDPAALGSTAAQSASPKDGDTKQGADGMLVFQNGHWHKVEPAAPISIAKSKLGDHVSVMDSWPQTGPQLGSNPGGKFKDKGGQEWYCKFPADAEMVRSEFLAAKFYQMLGVDVPTLKLVEKDGKLGIASKWVDGMKKGSAENLASAAGAHQAFAIDAWIGNWDVVGMANDNLLLNSSGGAVRIDVGGSLDYRAMGGKKGADFGDTVAELKTMKDYGKNAKAAAVFAGATDASIAWGGKQLNKLKPSQIEELCKIAGPGTDAEKAALAKKLIARRADVLKQMGIVDQWDTPPVDETKLTVDPADIKPPLDFNTLNGGKPVSSKQHVNDKNSADSAALAAFAMQGNLKALKDYHYDAVDKETGQSIGKKPITEHPSNHIQQQWASLVQTLQSIGYPPVETLEMPSLGSFGLVSEIADAVGSFAPGQNVTTIPQEHRLGYFMKLCQIDEGDAVALLKRTKWFWQKSGTSFAGMLKAAYQKVRSTTKTYISSVQGSGAANHLWSHGKSSYDSTPINKVTAGIYDDAVDLPEGTQMWRWMDDDTAGKSMTKQLLATKPGAILQNTDSMCTSFHESWGDSPHFTNGDGKQIKMRIRCAAGCKATPTYGTGSLGSEGELTTLPGQRYLVVDVQPGGHNHPQGVFIDVIMLPPDTGFVAQLKGQTLAKSLRSNSEWDKKETVIVYRQEPSRTRQARPVLAILM